MAVFHAKAYSVQLLQRFDDLSSLEFVPPLVNSTDANSVASDAIVNRMKLEELRQRLYAHGIVKVLRQRLPELVL